MNELVTADKLVDLTPTWASFPGWTVLLDPGSAHHFLDDSSGMERLALASPLAHEPLLALLGSAADRLAETSTARGITALLPSDTYHVTLCDGFNVRSPLRAPAASARRLTEMIAALPGVVADADALTLGSGAALAALIEAAAQPITLAFDALEIRGAAVVAALEPTDASTSAVAAIEAARTALLTAMSEVAGQDLVTTWRPHISLAYLANESRDDALAGVLTDATAELSAAPPASTTIAFRGAGTYAFADMITFLRPVVSGI